MPLLRRVTISLYTTVAHHFSAATTTAKKIPTHKTSAPKLRPKSIKDAQNALTDYLSTVRNLPLTYVENISKNSLCSLSHNIISMVEYSSSSGYYRSLQRFLRYHPINEFEFFYESIGIDYKEIGHFLPANKFFLSQDVRVFEAACALCGFGFPWNKLGGLYKDQVSIFSKDPRELNTKLHNYADLGFDSVSLCGICLVFPYVLAGSCEMSGEIDALFDDMKSIFVDFGLRNDVECNVDAWCDVCRKIKLFYDLGCQKGKVGDLMGQGKNIFIEHSEEVLVWMIEFFCRLDVGKEEVGLFLLSRPEIFKLNLKSPMMSVLRFLKHFGLEGEELSYISQKYPHVFGRNKLANLPHVMKSLDLNEWFFCKMKNGDHHLLGSYVIGSPDEGVDKEFTDNLVKIESSTTRFHTVKKLEFLHRMGYGENKLTVKILEEAHGTSNHLQERFDCLLSNGIGFSKLCKMVSTSPKILNQNPESLTLKVKFLCEDVGSSLQYLDLFPAYLCFNLEARIKPRYRFHMWLKETGLCGKEYSISSMIATSEKAFIRRIYKIHPAAPKKWLEVYLNKD